MGKKQKFNVYKILKKEELLQELETREFKRIAEKTIDEHCLELFFFQKDNGGEIWWIEQYRNIFTDIEDKQYRRSNLYGVLLISHKDYSYAISYGNAYFYIQKYCDYNFGLDLAERILNPSNVKSKVSKYFNIDKAKEIVEYNNNINLEFTGGEAAFYVQGAPINTDIYGKKIKFGYSAAFHLNMDSINIVEFISSLENLLVSSPRIKIPRVKFLHETYDQELIVGLNQELYNDLLSESDNVRVEYFGLVGTDIVNDDTLSLSICMKGKRKKTDILELDIPIVKEYLLSNSVQDINFDDVRITFETESNKRYSRPLRELIDYTIQSNDRYYCLVNGKWAEFNQSYVQFLESKMAEINEIVTYQKDYDFKVSVVEELKQKAEGNLKYNEFVYNKYYMSQYGFKCYDRDFIKYGNVNIELGDLLKDQTLYHVKIGDNGKLIYAVDQSMLSIYALKDPKNAQKIKEKFGEYDIQGIGLLLIFESRSIAKDDKINLNNIKSILFKMKILNWYSLVKVNNYKPQLLVNFKD